MIRHYHRVASLFTGSSYSIDLHWCDPGSNPGQGAGKFSFMLYIVALDVLRISNAYLCKLICYLWQAMLMYQLLYVCLPLREVQHEILYGKANILINAFLAVAVKSCLWQILEVRTVTWWT